MARGNLDKIIEMCSSPLPPIPETPLELFAAQEKALSEVTMEFIKHVTGPNTALREQVSMFCFEELFRRHFIWSSCESLVLLVLL